MEPMDAAIATEMMDEIEPTEDQAEQVSTPQIIDDMIKDMILKRKEASRTWRQDKKKIWDRCWRHYKQVYDTTNKETWQSTTFIPASPKVAEVIVANMHAATLGPERPVEWQSRQPEFENPVRDVNDLVAIDVDRSQFKVHWTDVLRTNGIIGTGVGKVEYKKEYATVKVKERMRPNPMMAAFRRMVGMEMAPEEATVEKQVLVKDYSCVRNVDPYNIFPEPGSEEIDKDHWVIEEGKICNYKLIELENDPDNPLRNITPELLMSSPQSLDPSGDEQEKDEALDDRTHPTAYMEPDQEHVLDEYWGPAPIWMVYPELYGVEEFKYQMVHAWLWLIDGMHVVRAQPTPFRDAEPPYVKVTYIRVPGQFWGIGPLELMMGLQIEMNEIRNTRQDEVNLRLSKPIAVLKDMVAKGEWDRLVSGPGAIWLFEGVDDIKKAFQTIEYDSNMQDSWRASLEIINEIQEVTAAVKATIGTGGGGDQAGGSTFRGQLMNAQMASERFMMYARVLEITGLGKAYRKMYHRIYQYKDWKQAAEMLGQKRAQTFEYVAPEDLDKMARVVPMGVTTMENKGVKLAQMAEQYKMFMGQEWFKPVEHARRMMVVGGDDPDLSIFSDEELKVLNDFKKQMRFGGGGLGVPPGPGGPGGPPPGPPSGPVAGNVPGPTDGQPRPAMPARGPGASPIDVAGRPLS